MLVGYARVSTQEQNLDMQIVALEAAGCEKIFSEKISAVRHDRAEYQKMKEFIRDGADTVVVYKLDRLGRSLQHLIQEMHDLNTRLIGFKSLQEHIDTHTPGGKLLFHVFAAIAEFEKDIIKERTLCGLAAARARGRLGGRPKKLTMSQLDIVKKLYLDKTNDIKDICKSFKISKPTLFRLMKIKTTKETSSISASKIPSCIEF